MFNRLRAYVRGLLRREAIDAEVDEELRFHVEMETQANIQRGMTPVEARRVALRDIGGVTQTRESIRHLRTPAIESAWQDLLEAIRSLAGRPLFALGAIFTIALAIGANTAILSVADAVLFRPLPYTEPDRVFVVQVSHRTTGQHYTLVRQPYLDLLDGTRGATTGVGRIEEVAGPLDIGPEGPERVATAAVTPNYFTILGIRPVVGRVFDERDAKGPGRPAMLSYSLWRQRLAGDTSIVGQSITLGSTRFEVVGVLPAGFVHPSGFIGKPDLITLLSSADQGDGAFYPVVRLRPGVTRAQAEAQMQVLAGEAAKADPSLRETFPVLTEVRSVLYPRGTAVMRFLLASALLVLAVGCANLSVMLLARSKARGRDLALRIALGAPRIRLVRPVVFESLILGISGAALAVCVTWVTFDGMLQHVPTSAYGAAPVGVSGRVILFSLALGLVAGMAFGVVPAWLSARFDAHALLRRASGAGSGSGRVALSLVAAQVALALVLVFGAVVAGRAFLAVLHVPLGFQPDGVATVQLFAPRPAGGPLAIQERYVRAMETVAALPDVVSVGAAGSLPLDGGAPSDGIGPAGRRAAAGIVHVLPGYFETIAVPLVRGRHLSREDVRTGTDAAVLSERAARVLFPGRDPLGATFSNTRGRKFHVVGVVRDMVASLDGDHEPLAFAIGGVDARRLTLVVRTRNRGGTTLAGIKRALSRVIPGTPIEVDWWSDDIARLTVYRNPRFQTIVLVSFAVLALILTAVGTFATVSALVATRLREMGVRVAMGATPGSLVRLMVSRAIGPVVVGLVAGLLATRWLARLAESQLFAVDTKDRAVLAAATLIVTAGTVLAAWLPARRAGKVDPVVVLRSE